MFEEFLTTSQVGQEIGINDQHLRRLHAYGLIQPRGVLNRRRIYSRDQLPKIREVSIDRGYLSAQDS
jgi:DNA-binding transcriptional MerR regulator